MLISILFSLSSKRSGADVEYSNRKQDSKLWLHRIQQLCLFRLAGATKASLTVAFQTAKR